MEQLKAQLVLLHTLGKAGAAPPKVRDPLSQAGGLSLSPPLQPSAMFAAAQTRLDFDFAFPKDLRRFSLLKGKKPQNILGRALFVPSAQEGSGIVASSGRAVLAESAGISTGGQSPGGRGKPGGRI